MRSQINGRERRRPLQKQETHGDKVLRAGTSLAVAFMIAGAATSVPETAPTAHGTLHGHVRNAATGQAILGAIVVNIGTVKRAGQSDGSGYSSISLPPRHSTGGPAQTQDAAVNGQATMAKNRMETPDFALVPLPMPTLSPSASSSPPLAGVLTDGTAVLAAPEVAKPPYLSGITSGPFGAKVRRIAGDPGMAIQFARGATGVWNSDARHHYSTDEPWNVDETLIAMDQPGGNPDLLFLDGNTYQPKYPRCANYNRQDDRWHPSLPNVRINADGMLLEWFDIVHCTRVKSWTLPFAVTYLGLTNGNVSNDGRLIALGTTSEMFIVDMVGNRIGPAVRIAYAGWMPTGLGVSPSGKYAWVHYQGDYTRIFDIDPTKLAMTPHPEAGVVCHGAAVHGFIYDLAHQDIALNPFDNNEDVMIGQEHCGNVGKKIAGQLMGHVIMVRLRDGAITSLTDPINEAYAYHVSGRASDRPGWVYVSYYENQGGLRFNQELISVKMDGSKAVERWAHLHTDTTNCYRCEAHPVPSRDGLRVIFASTWSLNCGTGCGTQMVRQDYVVDGRPPN